MFSIQRNSHTYEKYANERDERFWLNRQTDDWKLWADESDERKSLKLITYE